MSIFPNVTCYTIKLCFCKTKPQLLFPIQMSFRWILDLTNDEWRWDTECECSLISKEKAGLYCVPLCLCKCIYKRQETNKRLRYRYHQGQLVKQWLHGGNLQDSGWGFTYRAQGIQQQLSHRKSTPPWVIARESWRPRAHSLTYSISADYSVLSRCLRW